MHYRDYFCNVKGLFSLRVSLCEAANKAWVLGSEHFKQKIANQLYRRSDKLTKGGDRKLDEYRKHTIKRV